jgi:predicted PolB exonuclease-like 3'-5' exonuclease
MIKKKDLAKYLIFDVETASQYPSYETLESENPILAKLWKKRHTYYSGNYFEYQGSSFNTTYMDKAPLEPEFSKIVSISFASFKDDLDNPKIITFHGDEVEILEKTKKILQNAMVMNFLLCGHNIKVFDIPCIGKRMLYNGINPPDIIKVSNKKPWELSFVDTVELFSFGSWSQQKSLSLDLLCCCLQVPSPKGSLDGSEVNSFYHSGRIDEIVSYCERDVEALARILVKISE